MSLLIHSRVASTSTNQHRPPIATASHNNVQPRVMDIGTVTDDVYTFHVHSPAPVTTPYYCGLPYQDHNYGAPPPPSPPPRSPPIHEAPASLVSISPEPPPPPVQSVAPATVSPTSVDDKKDKKSADVILVTKYNPPLPDSLASDDSVTRCICDYTHDDGYMICCDTCSVWQHIDCWTIDRNHIPDSFFCELCEPRPVDKVRARKLQTNKRQNLAGRPGVKKFKVAKRAKSRKFTKVNNGRKINHGVMQNRRKNLIKVQLSNSVASMKKIKHNKNNIKKVLKSKPIKLRNTNNSALIHLFCEDAQHAWRDTQSLAAKNESNSYNTFSADLQHMLSTRKINGFYDNVAAVCPDSRLCRVMNVAGNKKGLVSTGDIACNEDVIEYTGTVMLRDQFDKENIFYSSPHPFVLFTRVDDIDVCIDATNSSNDARYIRRSCTPNAEVQQLISHDGVHFVIISKKSISKGTEITIAFDFKYVDCLFAVDCACSRGTCPVSKLQYRRRSKINLHRTTRKKRLKEKEVSNVTVDDDADHPEDVMMEDTETKRGDFVEESTPVKKEVEVSPVAERTNQVELLLNAAAYLQENEIKQEVASVDIGKKMTREERKIEAIMRAFEKMEQQAEKRRGSVPKKQPLAKGDSPAVAADASSVQEAPVAVVDDENSVDAKPDVTPPAPTTPAPATARRRRKSQLGRRRTSRTVAHSEPSSAPATAPATASATDDSCSNSTHPPDQPSLSQSTPSTPAAAPITDLTPPLSAPPQQTNATSIFKIKSKRHLMNEWLSEKSAAKCEPLEVSIDEKIFVTCLPSPRTSLDHMRRSSVATTTLDHLRRSATTANSAATSPYTPRIADSLGISVGSAKKRWLRQAMSDHPDDNEPHPISRELLPSHGSSISSLDSPVSPNNSAYDFVTPLKKRRLARESLDLPPTPSSLSPQLSDIASHKSLASSVHLSEDSTKQEEDTSGLVQSSNMADSSCCVRGSSLGSGSGVTSSITTSLERRNIQRDVVNSSFDRYDDDRVSSDHENVDSNTAKCAYVATNVVDSNTSDACDAVSSRQFARLGFAGVAADRRRSGEDRLVQDQSVNSSSNGACERRSNSATDINARGSPRVTQLVAKQSDPATTTAPANDVSLTACDCGVIFCKHYSGVCAPSTDSGGNGVDTTVVDSASESITPRRSDDRTDSPSKRVDTTDSLLVDSTVSDTDATNDQNYSSSSSSSIPEPDSANDVVHHVAGERRHSSNVSPESSNKSLVADGESPFWRIRRSFSGDDSTAGDDCSTGRSAMQTSTLVSSTNVSDNLDSTQQSRDSALSQEPSKKKVSLLEYRKRLKDKGQDIAAPLSTRGKADDGGAVTSLTNAGPQLPCEITAILATPAESMPSLAPLPLFEPTADDAKLKPSSQIMEPSGRGKGKQASLGDRLHDELGVDSISNDEGSRETTPPPPPPPPPKISSAPVAALYHDSTSRVPQGVAAPSSRVAITTPLPAYPIPPIDARRSLPPVAVNRSLVSSPPPATASPKYPALQQSPRLTVIGSRAVQLSPQKTYSNGGAATRSPLPASYQPMYLQHTRNNKDTKGGVYAAGTQGNYAHTNGDSHDLSMSSHRQHAATTPSLLHKSPSSSSNSHQQQNSHSYRHNASSSSATSSYMNHR